VANTWIGGKGLTPSPQWSGQSVIRLVSLPSTLALPDTWADDTRSGAYIWPDLSAPRYIPGFVSTTMFQFGSLVFAVMAWYLLRKFPYPVKPLVVQVEGQRRVGA
jgi:hypothetical protein